MKKDKIKREKHSYQEYLINDIDELRCSGFFLTVYPLGYQIKLVFSVFVLQEIIAYAQKHELV